MYLRIREFQVRIERTQGFSFRVDCGKLQTVRWLVRNSIAPKLLTRSLALPIVIVALFLQPARSESPRWRGLHGDGVVHDFRVPSQWPERLTRLWSVTVGQGHSSPITFGDTVLVQSRERDDEVLRAFTLEDGSELWGYRTAANATLNQSVGRYGSSPRATPAYRQGRVVALSVAGTLLCLDSDSGREIWTRTFTDEFEPAYPQFGTAASPLIVEGTCVAIVGNHRKGRLAGFDLESGRQQWSIEIDGAAYASPVQLTLANKRLLVVLTDKSLLGFSSFGRRLWKHPYTTQHDQNIVTATSHDGLIFVSGYHNPLISLRKASGHTLSQVWENRKHPIYMSSPVVANGLLFGMSQRDQGHIFCVDATSGQTKWTSEGRMGDNVSVQLVGDLLVLLSDTGRLWFAKANAQGYQEVAAYSVSSGSPFAHPILEGHRILVKDQDSLICYSVR